MRNRVPVSAATLLPGAGMGLVGLSERVGLVGGELEWGRAEDGGWRVRAHLPWAAPCRGGRAMTRVLIVDDEALVRAGLRMILSAADDLDVVAEAEDGADAVDAVRAHRPDVVLMDIRMPRLDGLAATRAVLALDPATAGRGADHVRPGRLRVPRARGRGERLPAQGHAAA